MVRCYVIKTGLIVLQIIDAIVSHSYETGQAIMRNSELKPIFHLLRVTMILFAVLITTSCGEETPREKFRNILEDKVDTLISKLKYVGTNIKETIEGTTYANGRSGKVTMKVLRSSGITSVMVGIEQHFSRLPITFLTEDIAQFDAWGDELKEDIESYRHRIDEAARKAAVRLKRYKKPDSNNGLVMNMLFKPGKAMVDQDGKLYFVKDSGRRRLTYRPDKIFEFGIGKWLVAIKKQSQQFQGQGQNSPSQ